MLAHVTRHRNTNHGAEAAAQVTFAVAQLTGQRRYVDVASRRFDLSARRYDGIGCGIDMTTFVRTTARAGAIARSSRLIVGREKFDVRP
jgi:hypothetical protein